MTEEQKAAAKQARANGIYFPEQYRKSLKGAAIWGVNVFRANNPKGNLPELLAEMLGTANPQMPPLYLLEFAQHIIETWMVLEERSVSTKSSTEAIAA